MYGRVREVAQTIAITFAASDRACGPRAPLRELAIYGLGWLRATCGRLLEGGLAWLSPICRRPEQVSSASV